MHGLGSPWGSSLAGSPVDVAALRSIPLHSPGNTPATGTRAGGAQSSSIQAILHELEHALAVRLRQPACALTRRKTLC